MLDVTILCRFINYKNLSYRGENKIAFHVNSRVVEEKGLRITRFRLSSLQLNHHETELSGKLNSAFFI